MAENITEILERLQREPIMRTVALDRGTVSEDDRTVEIAIASDKPVDHWFGQLELSMDKKAVRTERIDEIGIPLLMGHDHTKQVGIIDSIRIDKDGVIRGLARFDEHQLAADAFRSVKNGFLRGVSAGFMVHKMDLKTKGKNSPDIYRSEDWEPYEASLTPIPADISVGVGRAANFLPVNTGTKPETREILNSTSEKNMSIENQTPAAPAVETTIQRTAEQIAVDEITGWGRNLKCEELATQFLRDCKVGASPVTPTVEGFFAAVRAAEKANATPVQVPALSAVEQAARQGGVQLARSIPRHGAIRSFKGENAAEKAYRFGKWLLGGPLKREGAAAWCAANGITLQRDQSEGVNEAGGYLVPEEFSNDLIDLREQYGVFRRNTKVVPMASDTHSDPRRTGGLTAVFEGEGDTGSVSTAGWDRVQLVAKKLMVLARYSSEISEDSLISMSDTLANEMAYAFANKEDECGFNGDGTSTYGGIVGVREKILGLSSTRANIAGLVVGSGNLYSELTLTDFEAVVAKLPEYADTAMAKWFVSRSFYFNVMVKLALATGGNAATDVEATRGKRFLGYDVEFAQVMPKVEANDQVCALLGDLSKGARMGTRRNTTISLSEHVLHSSDQIQVRGTERFDINVHDVGNASATAADRVPGPIVGLLTAAS